MDEGRIASVAAFGWVVATLVFPPFLFLANSDLAWPGLTCLDQCGS